MGVDDSGTLAPGLGAVEASRCSSMRGFAEGETRPKPRRRAVLLEGERGALLERDMRSGDSAPLAWLSRIVFQPSLRIGTELMTRPLWSVPSSSESLSCCREDRHDA